MPIPPTIGEKCSMKRHPEQVVWDFIQGWIKKAEGDLTAAEMTLNIKLDDQFIAAFHAQQAIEKYLKAFLVWRQVPFPKTHEIKKLLSLLPAEDEKLVKELVEADWLSPYGVEFRYPLEEVVDLETAKKAVDQAKKVQQAVMGRLKLYLEKGRPA